MQTRRSFFKKLGALIAVVALAPEIAFNRKLDIPALASEINPKSAPFWFQISWWYKYPSKEYEEALKAVIHDTYAVNRKLESDGKPSPIEVWINGTPQEQEISRKQFTKMFFMGGGSI